MDVYTGKNSHHPSEMHYHYQGYQLLHLHQLSSLEMLQCSFGPMEERHTSSCA